MTTNIAAALEQAGISLKSSAVGDHSYVWNCWGVLDRAKRVILAVDGDAPGRALAEELARRIGKAKCWRVEWPALGDAPRKDANEVLVEDGANVLRECVAAAKPYHRGEEGWRDAGHCQAGSPSAERGVCIKADGDKSRVCRGGHADGQSPDDPHHRRYGRT
jgi:hypothetical protein